MSKKVFFGIIVSIALVFSFNFVFATDDMQNAGDSAMNMVNDAEKEMQDSTQKAGNTLKDAGNTAGNVVRDAGNTAAGAVTNVTDSVRNTVDNAMTDDNNDGTPTTNNDNYTATRTDANAGTLMGMNATTWTWLIMGLAAIAIVALVWYYSAQITDKNYDNHND